MKKRICLKIWWVLRSRFKPRPKEPPKVHIWTAISIVMCRAMLIATSYYWILDASFVSLSLPSVLIPTGQRSKVYKQSYMKLLLSQFHQVVEHSDLSPTKKMWCF